MTIRESEIIGLIRKEVKPALGCTEPIAVALAVSKAMEVMAEEEALGDGMSIQEDEEEILYAEDEEQDSYDDENV